MHRTAQRMKYPRHIRTYTASDFDSFAPRLRQFIVEFIGSVLLEFGGDRLGG